MNKENAKEVANQTKSLTRSTPASEINTADVAFAADILDRIVKAGDIDSVCIVYLYSRTCIYSYFLKKVVTVNS